jgi:hypothetical protein
MHFVALEYSLAKKRYVTWTPRLDEYGMMGADGPAV